ncbi:hypothetical protein IJT93_03555 [bacterium]|nr:hypothetical protein [bacterium]
MATKIFSRDFHNVSRKNIDGDALRILYKLYDSGHTAYLVGGGVRDMLLNRAPKDFDISTSARPAQIRCMFGNCRLVGKRFRLAHIYCGKNGKIIEVSTFRRNPEFVNEVSEGEEFDGGDGGIIPDNTFGCPEEDAKRRDFTVNGLFYDIGSYSIIDFVGGMQDLKDGIVRSIGDPEIRFKEDPVRMLRAIKFCAKLDFNMEKETWKAIYNNRRYINSASTPRVQEELMRFLEYDRAERSFELLLKSGLMTILMPHFIDYLRQARDGKVPSDPHCEYFWQTLELCDSMQLSRRGDRQLLAAVISLPLFLQAFDQAEQGGLDLNDFGNTEWIAEAVGRCCECFGFCRHSQDKIIQYYNLLRRIILFDRKKTKLKEVTAKAHFSEAFVLYQILYGLKAIDENDYIFWRGAYDKSAAKTSVSAADRIERKAGCSPERAQ